MYNLYFRIHILRKPTKIIRQQLVTRQRFKAGTSQIRVYNVNTIPSRSVNAAAGYCWWMQADVIHSLTWGWTMAKARYMSHSRSFDSVKRERDWKDTALNKISLESNTFCTEERRLCDSSRGVMGWRLLTEKCNFASEARVRHLEDAATNKFSYSGEFIMFAW